MIQPNLLTNVLIKFMNFLKPIIGWISGIAVDEIGKKTAKTINGSNKKISEQNAVAIHFTLATNKVAKIGIINIFEQGTGDIITFGEIAYQLLNQTLVYLEIIDN